MEKLLLLAGCSLIFQPLLDFFSLFTPARSPLGDQVVAFANFLAKSVRSKQLSEAAAEREWIKFKMTYSWIAAGTTPANQEF